MNFYFLSDFLHLKGGPYVNNVFLIADATIEIKMCVLSQYRLVKGYGNKSMCKVFITGAHKASTEGFSHIL